MVPHKAVCSARCSSRFWPMTALPSSAPTTSSSLPMTHQWWVSSATTMKRTTELAEWCCTNNLSLNVSKTKEVVMDFRRNSVDHPTWPSTARLWRVSSTKFLGVHIKEDLTWTTNTTSLSKKEQQRLHFLRRLKRASLPPPILTTFYRGTIESVLTSCITVWYGTCSAADRKTLQQTVNTAAKITGAPLPSILDIFLARCSSKATSTPPIPPTVSSSSYHQEHGSRASEPAPPDCSTALSPRLWEPWTQIPPAPESFFMQFEVRYTQVSGPVQTTCSNTLSSIRTRHFSHITICTYFPKKLHSICMFTCSCTTNHLTLFTNQLLLSAHVQYSFEAFVQFVFF